jgi:hypothetical protein
MLLEFHLPTPQCNPQLKLWLRTSTLIPEQQLAALPMHICPLLGFAVPLSTWLSWLSAPSMWNRYSLEKNAFPNPPPSFPPSRLDGKRGARFLHRCLCTSWVFYRDGNIPYRPLFFARVTSENHEPFIMRMSAEWFKAAKTHMDSPSLGRSLHHVKGKRTCAARLDFTSSPQMCLRTQELGVRSVDKNGHCQATTNCFRRMANLCESIPCA